MAFWLKVAHLSAVSLWAAGLCLLPALYLARTRGTADGDAPFFNIVANTLYFRVLTPAGGLAIAFGAALFATGPDGPWLVVKLVLVAALVGVHLQLGLALYRLGREGRAPRVATLRALAFAAPLLLLAIAAITGAKPGA